MRGRVAMNRRIPGSDPRCLALRAAAIMLAIALQADQVVIAENTPVTDWWLFEVSPSYKLAYFGTQETFKAWKLKQVQ